MLNKKEIEQLLHSTETSRVERTVSTSDMDKFQEAICAFSNDMANSRKNGYLIIGAHDNGTLSGLKVDDALFKKISGIRSDGNILPLPMMTCERYEMEGGDLLVVEVQPAFTTPVRYRGRTFIRIGPRRDIATIDEERILSEKRTANMATFDAVPCFRTTLDDVYVDRVEDYIRRAVDAKTLAADTRTLEQQMAALSLFDIEHNCPTNACMVLFGKNPKQFMFGGYVQFVKFKGANTGTDIENEQTFTDCLSVMMPKLEAFVDYGVVQRRPVAVSTLREETVTSYPADALRELMLNALMHRDYQSNMPTRFYQFPDRIEIMNPGGLYGKARPENFPLVNDYRNPIIAQALKTLGYVNMFNRGVNRVKQMMADNGNPEPRFNVDKITVFEVVTTAAFEESTKQEAGAIDWDAMEFVALKNRMLVALKNKFQVTKNQSECIKKRKLVALKKAIFTATRILECIQADKKTDIPTMKQGLETSERYISDIIKVLKHENIINHIGPTNGGEWVIITESDKKE